MTPESVNNFFPRLRSQIDFIGKLDENDKNKSFQIHLSAVSEDLQQFQVELKKLQASGSTQDQLLFRHAQTRVERYAAELQQAIQVHRKHCKEHDQRRLRVVFGDNMSAQTLESVVEHGLTSEILSKEQSIVRGTKWNQPRLTCNFSSNGATYTYSNVKREALPIPDDLQWILDEVWTEVKKLDPKHPAFNYILCNYYRNGEDKIGLHSDDESELGPNTFIASLSLGATRHFDIHPKASCDGSGGSEKKFRIDLHHGDLLWTKACDPSVIVELGVRQGESSRAFFLAAKETNAIVIGVDLDDCQPIYEKIGDQLDYPLHEFLKMDSSASAKYFGKEVDVLFLDTSHLREPTQHEIQAWLPRLRDCKSLFLFHDTNLKETYVRRDGTIGEGWDNQRGVISVIQETFNVWFDETLPFYEKFINGSDWCISHDPLCNGLTALFRGFERPSDLD
ncbi:unnamed protein product [Sphagnum jensenii]|uniref:Alpha-ketoglutarate-dependent dioxygenase AlkB-like domain-containing protein n=1 Tax=Sphagnum jensenii TaxID=128206 RepID=A0ABP0VF04_9BRYO